MQESQNNEISTKIKQVNPLLERLNKLPGTSIRLPSRGLFYTDGELDSECMDGEVQVLPMTTTDELMMRSIDMLFQGTAIENVIHRCLPQIKKPMRLLVGDIDYILTQLRRVSYGTHIPMNYECDCAKTPEEQKKRNQAGDNEYMIPVDHLIQNTKELDIKDFNKTFKVTLSNKQTVTLQPLRFEDFISLQQMDNPDLIKDPDVLKDYVATNFTSITMSVDEISDKEMIKEWYMSLPRLEAEKIKKKLNSMNNWGIEFKYTIECHFCKEKRELTTQLNPMYFFMLPSSPETQN